MSQHPVELIDATSEERPFALAGHCGSWEARDRAEAVPIAVHWPRVFDYHAHNHCRRPVHLTNGSPSLRRCLVTSQMALAERPVIAAYQRRLASLGIKCSMSRRGNCWDNAVPESFYSTLKVEWIDHHQFRTRAEARAAIFDFIEVFYNRQRRHSSLGYLSPEAYARQINSA